MADDEEPLIQGFLARIRSNETRGTYAVAFGAISGVFGSQPEQTAAALMHSTATAILQASMRLLPVSHRDVQRALHALRPVIADAAAASVVTVLNSLAKSELLAEVFKILNANLLNSILSWLTVKSVILSIFMVGDLKG